MTEKHMLKNLKVGVVGCGYWGPNLIRNFNSLPDCNLKLVCDVDPARLKHMKTLYPAVEAEMNFDHMLNGANLDAVVIATSVNTHFKMAKASLLAGKHVFIEKPMAASSEQCEELNDLAQKKGLVLMVGHTFLYSSPIRRIKELIDKGDIGELRYISSRRLNLGLFQKNLNVAWDLAPHDIAIVLYIMGELPVGVNCWGNAHITPGVEDVTSMCINFAKDRFATIQSSWLDPRKIRDMTFIGTKRMIVYDDMEALEKVRIYDMRVETPPHYDTFAEFQYSYHYGDQYIPYVKQEEPLKVECQHFLDCIRHGKVPMTDGKQGLSVVKILEASSASLKQKGAMIPISYERSKPALPQRAISPARRKNGAVLS